jgi:hypothetical protein
VQEITRGANLELGFVSTDVEIAGGEHFEVDCGLTHFGVREGWDQCDEIEKQGH